MFRREPDLSGNPISVIAWRIDRLRDAGFPARLAEKAARDAGYDVHALLELTDRGCPAELAVRILPPLGAAQPALTNSQDRLIHRTGDARSGSDARASAGSSRNSVAAGRTERGYRSLIEGLSATGAERDAALVELHVLLSRAARFEVNRRCATSPQLRDGDHCDLAHQSADDARVAILRALGALHVESRFRTWAYKFAVYEAAVRVRNRAWQGRGIPLEAETWPLTVDDPQSTGQQSVETTDTLAALSEAIERELSPHRREVLVAIALNGVPIDVLAERLNTTRGALYTTLRDGRQQLRAALTARGMDIDDQLSKSQRDRTHLL